MKNRLLPLFVVLGCYSAYSQVGIGKIDPNKSAQLEVYSADKGVLIPQVKLTGTTDKTTIKNGNVSSLLVFNTVTAADVTPGYYYWYAGKWQRIVAAGEAGSGKDGINGGNGAPGEPGVVIPANTTIYVDNSTGTVYILKPGTDPLDPKNWIPMNGKNGLDGKNGIAGGNGVPGAVGTPGIDGTVEMYIDYKTGIIYVRDPENHDKWVPVSGKNGIDGIQGVSGVPGTPGSITTLDAIVKDPQGNIYAYVGDDKTVAGRDAEWASKSPNWVKINGINGLDGKNGIAGGNGVPGAVGTPGIDGTIEMYIDYKTGIIYVRDPKDHDKWIPVSGKNGIDGIQGVSGAPGTPGSITTLDAIVKDPQGNIYAYVGTDKTVAGRDAEWAAKSVNW
ncbi:hypothetical protein ABXT06_22605, partial [Flavobacterium sp. UW10123]